jgi:energy-converting hydrogenase B subunit D
VNVAQPLDVTLLQAVVLVLVAAGGWAVVVVRDPVRQAMVAGIYGMTLTVLFVVFQAPDVALSMAAVGAVALPLMIILALAKTRRGP